MSTDGLKHPTMGRMGRAKALVAVYAVLVLRYREFERFRYMESFVRPATRQSTISMATKMHSRAYCWFT